MDVADLDELKDEIEDNMAEINERQEFFADIANEDADDLMDELNELEAEGMMDDLDDMNLDPVNPIKPKPKPAVISDVVSEEEDEEEALAKLMAWEGERLF